MQDWIEYLINFFRTNEPFFSGLGNFIAILTAVLAVLGVIFGWWRRLYRWIRTKLQGEAAIRAAAFPFEVISSPEQLMARLLPDPKQRVIPDREIRYIPGRAEGLDTLFEKHGRILIRGRSKAGKTREMAELISQRWHASPNVLFLRPNAWLEAPFVVPEELPYRNVVLVINDVDHYCTFDRPLSTGDDSTPSAGYHPFPQRLQRAIEYFETICGSPGEVRVVATVRREPEFWDKIQYDPKSPPWNNFKLFELDDLPAMVAARLIDQLSEMTGIRVIDDAKTEMAAQNDGTFLNIILAFRDWQRTGVILVDTSHIRTFEGELANTWQRRYERAVAANPVNRYVYAAIDILRRINLAPHRLLVAELATRLEGSVTAKLSRTIQTQTRRLYERAELIVLHSKIAKRIGDRYPAISNWLGQLAESRLGKAIRRLLLYETGDLGIQGGSAKIRKALQQLVETEIPIQNDILMPYDGQVDGRGDEWIGSGVVSALLAERASGDEHFVYGLISLADKLSDDHNYQAALRMLDSAVQIAPRYIFARQERAQVYRILRQYDAALSDIDTWIHLDPSDYVACAHKALVLRDMERYDEANELIGQAISMSPAQAWLYAQKAEILANQGVFDEAHKTFDKALALNPRRRWTYGEKAIALRQQGKYADALELVDRGLALKPDEDWLWAQRGITLRMMERYDEALVAFDKAIQLDPKVNWYYAHKGITLRLMERYNEALAAFGKASELDPKWADAFGEKAVTLRQLQRYDEALVCLDKAATLLSQAAWPSGERGITLRLMERYDEALAAFDKAIELDPKVGWVYGQRGIVLRLMERYDEALAAFDKAIELDPRADWVYVQKGIALREMERYGEALEWIDKGLEIDSSDAWNHYQRGVTLREMERYDEALAVFDKAIGLDPRADWAYAQKGTTLRLMERYDEALAAFDKALELDPKADWVYVQKGITLREMERYDEALGWIDKGLDIDPSDAWNHYQRGITLREMKRYDEAIAAFQKTIEMDSEKAYVWTGLGYSYLEQGDLERAGETLEKAIERVEMDDYLPFAILGIVRYRQGQSEPGQVLFCQALERCVGKGLYDRLSRAWLQVVTGERATGLAALRETLRQGQPPLRLLLNLLPDIDLLAAAPEPPQGLPEIRALLEEYKRGEATD
jgi:tetratricopeptide (TPR) repeat protein